MITQQMTQTERRQDVARTYVYPRVATSLVNQIDQTILTATDELGETKYVSRNEFVESAIRQLLIKERRKSA